MSTPRFDDIILACGGDWLARYGVPFLRRSVGRFEAEAALFARADAATCASKVTKAGTIAYAAANKLRCSWDYANQVPQLLLEPQRVNRCLRSEDLTTTWALTAATISANSFTAPDGAATADKIVETAVNSAHHALQTITITANEHLAVSCFVRAAERTMAGVRVMDSTLTDGFGVDVNLANGTVTPATYGAGTNVAVGVTPLGNSWYRVWAVGKVNLAETSSRVVLSLEDSGGALVYTGNGTNGAHFWGAQLERFGLGNVDGPSSYIPTVASAVTREADALRLPLGLSTPSSATEEFTLYGKATADWIAIPTGMTNAPGLCVLGFDTNYFGSDLKASLDIIPETAGQNMVARLRGDNVVASATVARGLVNPFEFLAQVRYNNAAAVYKVYLELDNGNSALSASGVNFANLYPWAENYLRPGARGNVTAPGAGLCAIQRLFLARGRFTMAEMRAAPLP